MKILKKTTVIMLLTILLCTPVYAANTVLRAYTVSTLDVNVGKINDSGFAANGTAQSLVDCSADEGYSGTAIKVGDGASAGRLDDAGWGGANSDTLVLSMLLKPDGASATATLLVYNGNNPNTLYLMQFSGSTLYALGAGNKTADSKVDGFTVANKWYDVTFVFRKKPDSAIDLYIDGELIKTTTDTVSRNLVAEVTGSTLRNLRISCSAGAVLLVGDGASYVPGEITFCLDKTEIETTSGPVTVSFSSPVRTELTPDNIIVTDSENASVSVLDVTVTKDINGFITDATLAFAEGALTAGGSYTVGFTSDVIGSYGQGMASPVDGTNGFKVLSEPYMYSLEPIKLYKGIGKAETEIAGLSAGMLSIQAAVKNDGRIPAGKVTLVLEQYQGGIKQRSFKVTRNLNNYGDTAVLKTGLYMKSVTSETEMKLTVKDSNGLTLKDPEGNELTVTVRGGGQYDN